MSALSTIICEADGTSNLSLGVAVVNWLGSYKLMYFVDSYGDWALMGSYEEKLLLDNH